MDEFGILAIVIPENNHYIVLLQVIVNVTIIMKTVKVLAPRHRCSKPIWI